MFEHWPGRYACNHIAAIHADLPAGGNTTLNPGKCPYRPASGYIFVDACGLGFNGPGGHETQQHEKTEHGISSRGPVRQLADRPKRVRRLSGSSRRH